MRGSRQALLYRQEPRTVTPTPLPARLREELPEWVLQGPRAQAAMLGYRAFMPVQTRCLPTDPQHMWEASARNPPTHVNVPKQSN